MASVSERFAQEYLIRREVSQTPDLAVLLLGRLALDSSQAGYITGSNLAKQVRDGSFVSLVGDEQKKSRFAQWLYGYLRINETTRGTSFYPVHPILALCTNGEGARVDRFIEALSCCFTPQERDSLCASLWSSETQPPFERALHDLIAWQLTGQIAFPPPDRFAGRASQPNPYTPEGILATTKEDLLALGRVASSVQSFVVHAGRLLAFAIARYVLVRAGVDLALPIYTAPAADSHPGVKTLAHEIIEVHRKQLGDMFHDRFYRVFQEELQAEFGVTDIEDEQLARTATKRLFHYNANVVPPDTYAALRKEYESLCDIAYQYYWVYGSSSGRFLRQLHASHLNLAKKAGMASSRSQYSQWHYYWIAPHLVETLLLVGRDLFKVDRMLVADLLGRWRDRYGISTMIDSQWADLYRLSFRSIGSPEALNEANRRRFNEILAQHGRLEKNSDDFPWVVLRD